MKKKILKVLSLVFVFAILFTACGQQNSTENTQGSSAQTTSTIQEKDNTSVKLGDKIKLKLMLHDADDHLKTWMKYTEPKYNAEFPNYNIELDFSPGTSDVYETKIRTLVSSGDAPDVWFSHGGSQAQPIIKAKAVLPLENYLDKMNFWDMCIPSAKVSSADGHIYALPFENIFYEIILYNTDIFSTNGLTPPKTYADLEKIVQTLKSKKITPFVIGGQDGWPVAMFIEGFAYSKDPEITPKVVKMQAKFSDEPYKYAVTKVKSLIDMGAFPDNTALMKYDVVQEMFHSGKAAMWPNGSWTLANTYEVMKGKVDYFYYPMSDEATADDYGKNIAGGVKQDAGVFVSANTKYPDDAVKLGIFIGKSFSQFMYEELGDPIIPYRADVFGWKLKKEVPPPTQRLQKDLANFQYVYGLLQDVMPTAASNTGLVTACSKFMTGQVSVEDMLKDLNKAQAAE